jgi:hypothetical protein
MQRQSLTYSGTVEVIRPLPGRAESSEDEDKTMLGAGRK